MNNTISLLVGLKNNLDYSKFFYNSTRNLYPHAEIVFVSYGSTDGTNDWLDSLDDCNVKYYYSSDNKTLSDTYNKCIEIATKEYVVFLHNDIVLTPNFIENLEKHCSPSSALTYTTIEPPIYADSVRPGKLIENFGEDLDSFKLDKLFEYSLKKQEEFNNKIGNGAFFFMCLSRDLLRSIGGFDNLFNPMFCEDDDLILRLRLKEIKMITILDSICYHFVSKTSRFSEEYISRTAEIELNSNRNFVRKWGFNNNSINKKKYNVAIIVTNCDLEILYQLEPYASNIYIDCDYNSYLEKEQPKTKICLSQKIDSIDAYKKANVEIFVDAKSITNSSIDAIQRVDDYIYKKKSSLIIKLFPFVKTFRRKKIKIKVNSYKSFEHLLIKNTDNE